VAWPYWYFLAARHLSHATAEDAAGAAAEARRPTRRNIGAGY
jgi:hypothetical protein